MQHLAVCGSHESKNQDFRKQNAFSSRSVAVHVQWWGVPQKAQSGNCFLGNVFEMLLMPQTTVCGLTRVSNCHFLSCPPLSPSSLHHTQENTNSNGTLASEFNPIFHCTANFKIIERVEINTSRRWKGQKNIFLGFRRIFSNLFGIITSRNGQT